jgi:hypothetical protein
MTPRSGKFFLTATSNIFSARKYIKVNEVCNEMLSVMVYSSNSNCRRPRYFYANTHTHTHTYTHAHICATEHNYTVILYSLNSWNKASSLYRVIRFIKKVKFRVHLPTTRTMRENAFFIFEK